MQQTADNSDYQQDQVHLAIGYHLDQYEIESILNIGDFRITYYAWDNRLERNVVIHEYFPKSLAIRKSDGFSVTSKNADRFTDFEFGLSEFLLEARLISQIHSAYLPNTIEYREANGTGYLISEYDDGKSMRQILDDGEGRLTDTQVNDLLKTGLQGLRELHARNLLHTSVNPSNLFIRSHGHPLLLGQGLARYRLAQYTKTYTVSLAPGYTPLEQYGLDGNIGPWSDLYALGASLYECIFNIRPIDASTRHTALIKGDPDPLTPAVELGKGQYSNLLLTNIDWMLKSYVEDRPDSADLMLGVVNFQKQNESIRSPKSASSTEADDTGNSEKIIPMSKLADRHNSDVSTTQTENARNSHQLRSERSGRFVYWGLGLVLIAFLAITGYQIYQHELIQKNAVPLAQEQDSQLLFNPEPIQVNEGFTESIEQAPVVLPDTQESENRDISKESDEARREFYENIAQEEEVKRLVEEELKAREAEIQAEQLLQQQAEQAQVAELIGKAQTALDSYNLLKPEGDSAFDYFTQALEIQQDNEHAITGIDDIAETYFSFAVKAIEDNDPDKANRHLADLIQVRPNDPRFDGFLQQITDLKAELKLEEEKKRLLEELAKAEESKAIVPQIESPDNKVVETIANVEETIADAPAKQIEEDISSIDVLSEENSDRQIEESEQVAVIEPKTPVINKVQLASAYNSYDTGRYSNTLFKTLLNAANENEGRAQYIVAEMYAAGRGTEQNFAESTFWLKRSLDYVNQNAKYRQPWAEKAMGVIYEKGWYVDSDTSRAVRWYKSSAEKGYSPAQYRLGLAYAKGLGVTKDVEQAEFWLKKALSNGHQEAKKALSKIPARN